MIQIWQAEDVDGCVCIDTILSLCILKTLCGPLCLTGEQWPSWHTGAFCFFYACVTLLYFETFFARVAFVLFFLSSAFSVLPFLSLYAGLSHYYCRIHEVTHGLVLYLVLVESFCKDLYVGVCGSGSDRGFMSLLALGQAVLCVCNWLHRVLPQLNTLCCGCGISVEPSQMFCSGED